MKTYLEMIELLGSPRLRRCAAGEAGVPILSYKAPAAWYGFPPALIPIWSDGSGPNYLGIWKHWFSSREPSFVKQYVGLGHLTVEIARTEEQFFAYVGIQAITSDDGISEPLRKFSDALGFSSLEEIDAVTAESGDDPRRFTSLSMFGSSAPLECSAPEVYDGSFPTPGKKSVEHASSFELKEEYFPAGANFPQWMVEGSDKIELFEKFLALGKFEGAWLTLNSRGWTYRQAAKCAKALAEKSPDKDFTSFIKVWIGLAEFQDGGY